MVIQLISISERTLEVCVSSEWDENNGANIFENIYITNEKNVLVTATRGKLQQTAQKHSGQGHTSLTICPTELKYVDCFVSQVALIQIGSTNRYNCLHMRHQSCAFEACTKFILMTRKWIMTKSNCHLIRHANENYLRNGPNTLRQPNQKKVDLPWKGKGVSPLIMHIHD